MHPELAEYLQCIDPEDLGDTDLVEPSYLEAQRIMSPQGLENYLVGIKAMCTLGKGQDLVLTYVQEMPQVVKEVGEDIIPDVIEALMKMASLTSGSVITLNAGDAGVPGSSGAISTRTRWGDAGSVVGVHSPPQTLVATNGGSNSIT